MGKLFKLWEAQRKDKKAFGRLREHCESKIVVWRHWDFPDWYWDPEHFVKYFARFVERGSKKTARYHFGYDAKGRVVLIRSLRSLVSGGFGYVFLSYDGDQIIGSKYLNEESDGLYCVFEAKMVDGRIVRLEQSGFCTDLMLIEWGDGKVSKIRKDDQVGLGPIVTETTYDRNGKVISEADLSEIEEEPPIPKGVTLKSQGEEIRKRLVQAVVKAVTKLKLKKPVYCLALNYDCEGNPIMPPMLGVGLDSERQARLKKGGKDAKLDIWEPEQMSLFAKEKTDEVIFNDKKLQQACDHYNRLLEKKGDNAPAHKLLNEIAAELCRMNWKGKLNTTDNFIAYAVDTDLADLQKNLRQSVPADRLKGLRAAKML